MNIEQEAKLLKLKGYLNQINHISYTYAQIGKSVSMNSANKIEKEELIKIYQSLLKEVRVLILNYENET